MAQANVTIIEAQMGEGKTNTATALVVDDYYSNLYAVKSPESGKLYTVKPHSHQSFWLPDGRLIKRPTSWETFSTSRIFANYHLFGMKYVYVDMNTMVELLNRNVISGGKLVLDEAYITGDARRNSTAMTVIATWFGQQMRKRDVELFLLVQHGRFIDWRFRYIAKRKILTSYNENTKMIRLLVQNLNRGSEKIVSYYAPQYWPYFDTNELPEIPTRVIEKAKGWAS